jgi:hypothetical protein
MKQFAKECVHAQKERRDHWLYRSHELADEIEACGPDCVWFTKIPQLRGAR